jgi:menaquinol-cytochrome c reductase iron-sulfur subunit
MDRRSTPPPADANGDGSQEAQTIRKQRTRREFLALVSAGLAGLGAVIVGVPVVGALLAPLLRPQPGQWRAVGAVDSFKVGETASVTFQDSSPLSWAGPAANTAAWLRRTGDQQFVAFAVNCTHLGCPVNWQPSSAIFICPCHGGVYYADGTVAAGPPPRRLFTYETRVVSGQVQLRATALQTA